MEPLHESFPNIMLRTSYDKAAKRYVEIADFFTPRGYAAVFQDFRGRFNSEGVGHGPTVASVQWVVPMQL